MRFLGLLAVVSAAVIGLGYYLGWFQFSAAEEGRKVDVHVQIDKQKIKKDVEKAKKEAGRKLKQASKEHGKQPAQSTATGMLRNVDPQHHSLTIVTREDARRTFAVNDGTRVERNGQDVAIDDLARGMRLTVEYHPDGGRQVADLVLVTP